MSEIMSKRDQPMGLPNIFENIFKLVKSKSQVEQFIGAKLSHYH